MLYFTEGTRFTKDRCYCVALCTDDKEEQERHLQEETRHSAFGYCVVATSRYSNFTQQVSKRYLYKGLAEKALAKLTLEQGGGSPPLYHNNNII